MENLGKTAECICKSSNTSDRLTRVYSQIDKSPEKSIKHSRRKRGEISVRLARTEQELFQAYRIAQDQYIDSGYTDRTSGDIRFLPHYALPSSYTFIAYENVSRPVGTVTLVLDRELGLPSEQEFSREIQMLRHAGKSLAEISCLATTKKCERMAVVIDLFKAVFACAHVKKGVTDFFGGVVQRHVKFYTRHLLFEIIGEAVSYPKINNIMVYPMTLEFNNLKERFEQKHNHDMFGRMFLEQYDFLACAEQIEDYSEEDLEERFLFSRNSLKWDDLDRELRETIIESFIRGIKEQKRQGKSDLVRAGNRRSRVI